MISCSYTYSNRQQLTDRMAFLISLLAFITFFFVVVANVCNLDCFGPMKLNCSDLQSTIKGKRCCVNNDTIVSSNSYTGIDLAGCNLTSISNLFLDMENLRILYLQDNNISTIDVEDFSGVLHLEMLKIPHTLECPGGIELWENITTDGDITSCMGEQSTCKVLNVNCPNANSYCHDVAPRLTECHCLPGFHGYKCLQKSSFPSVPFVIVICVGTALVSGLMWFTQRRHAKKNV